MSGLPRNHVHDAETDASTPIFLLGAHFIRRIAIGFGVLLYGLLIALTSYLFNNYSLIAAAACNRPVATAVVVATTFLALAYQAFFFLIVLVFHDILSSSDSNFRSLQVRILLI
jgi:hypothetical protein